MDGLLFLFRQGLLDDLHLTLGGVGTDGLELVLGRDHLAVLRTHALEVDGIEFALGRADAAADALIRIDNAAAAAQAAGRLGADLLFGERHAVVLHGAHLLAVDSNDGTCGLFDLLGRQNDVVLIELLELAGVAVDRQGLALIDEAVDGHRTLTAGRDRVDRVLRAGGAVAADEDVGLVGLERHGVVCDQAAVGRLCRGAGEHIAVDRALANGDQNVGARDGDGLVLVIDRGELAARVADGHAAHELDAGDLAALTEDGLRCPGVVDDDAVSDAGVLLVRNGGHLFVLLEAVHVHAALGQTQSRTRHVDGRVAAADDDHIARELLELAGIDFAQEVEAALNTGEVFAGDVELRRLLQADRDIKRLVALFAQLLDGDVLADFDAAFELHAHLAQHVDLGLDNVLADAEARDAVDEHTAGHGFLLEHDRAVALDGQEVSAGHAGRAAADDGDLLVKFLVRAGVHGRHVTVLSLHVLLGDELLDLVDGQRLVDSAAGAGILAILSADAAADGRERVILLDELERVGIAAVARHLDVALDGDVRRAGGLAGRRAGRPSLDAAVLVAVILVPVILAPLGVVRQLVVRILDGAFLRAELLAEAHSAGRAGLDTLAAGNALLRVALGHVSGGGQVRRVEQLAGAQCVADADSTVADTEDLVLAVDIRDLVDIAAVLGLLEDLHRLFIGDVVAMVRLAAVVGKVADADTPLAFHVAGALAADALLLAAGAHGHTDVALVLLQPVGQVLDRQRLALGRNGLLDRDNMHADAGASGRHHLGDARQRQIRHALEEVCRLREHIRLLGVDHHDLGAAGNEHIQHPALFMVRILAVEVLPMELDQTTLADGLHRFFQIGSVELRVLLRELLDRERHTLFHGQRDIEDIVRHLLIVL